MKEYDHKADSVSTSCGLETNKMMDVLKWVITQSMSYENIQTSQIAELIEKKLKEEGDEEFKRIMCVFAGDSILQKRSEMIRAIAIQVAFMEGETVIDKLNKIMQASEQYLSSSKEEALQSTNEIVKIIVQHLIKNAPSGGYDNSCDVRKILEGIETTEGSDDKKSIN